MRLMLILAAIALAGAGIVCFVGGICNAWAAWAPPGEQGANHAFYGPVRNLVSASSSS